jgi:purine-binding chemotaxis protein CheW
MAIEATPSVKASDPSGVHGAASPITGDQTQSNEFVSFAIGDDQYGVEIIAVREIKGWTGVSYLPKQPDYVRGVLNLRGVMVPIIDLRCRFGQGRTDASAMHVVIIVQIGERSVGLLADRVLDIVSFEDSKIQPVPKVLNNSQSSFLSGLITVDDAMIALIDLKQLLSHDVEVAVSAAA